MRLLCLMAAALSLSAQLVHAALPAVSAGRIERLADLESRQVPARPVDVWLPSSYPERGPHAVLYVHDGQMLFDAGSTWNGQEWRMDEVANALIEAGQVRPFIVVAIHNSGAQRHSEYFPQRPMRSLSKSSHRRLLALERAPGQPLFAAELRADAYLRFMVEELKPLIDARYRTLPAREHTLVMGASMGGLMALYALAEYPEVFGGAACLSTHWPGVLTPQMLVDGGLLDGTPNPVPAAFGRYVEQHLPPAGAHRLWFDHGTETLDALYPALQAQIDPLIRAKGYTATDWQTRSYAGAAHTETAWSERLDQPLRFLLGTERAAGAGLESALSPTAID